MSNTFDEFSDNYNEDLNESLKKYGAGDSVYFSQIKMNFLREKIGVKNRYKILDFGCGIGNNLINIEKLFTESIVYGTDISTESLRFAQKRVKKSRVEEFNEEFIISHIQEKFDLIIAINVFHHIPFSAHQSILDKLKSILRKNGHLLIFEHNDKNPLTVKFVKDCPFDKDVKLLPVKYSIGLLEKANFIDTELEYITFFPESLKVLLPLEQFLRKIPLGAQYVASGVKQ